MEIILNENRYANGLIYTIRSPNTEKLYIGSTCTTLCKRFYQHKLKCNNYRRGGKLFLSSFEIIMRGDAYIELLEVYPCATKHELLRREGELIRSNEKAVNLMKPIKDEPKTISITKEEEIDYKTLYENSEKIISELQAELELLTKSFQNN